MDAFFGAGAGFTGMVDAALDDAACCCELEAGVIGAGGCGFP